MNRRTFSKGIVASAALAMGSQLGPHVSLAQTPAYTANVVYQFSKFEGKSYWPRSDGQFWGVSLDGVITGRDWVDNVLLPVTWDLQGNRTQLDSTGLTVGSTGAVLPGPPGFQLGMVTASDDPSSPKIGVVWQDGTPRIVDPNAAGSVILSDMNQDGVIVGAVANTPTRWVGGQAEQLPLPDGASWGGLNLVADNGDAFGVAGTPNGNYAATYRWRVDGTVEDIELPAEVTADNSGNIWNVTVMAVFDNGDFVLAASWSGASSDRHGSWIYHNGVPQKVASSSETTYATIGGALDPTTMYGIIDAAQGDTSGFTGPALWLDGVPYSLASLTTLPAGVPVTHIRGMTSNGVIVASTYEVNTEKDFPADILVLQPAASQCCSRNIWR